MATPKDRDLSLTLIGLAASLLVGTFAAYNGYLAVADPEGDKWLTVLLVACTVILTLSIVFGGWGISLVHQAKAQAWYNAQAVVGLFGLVAVLLMPISTLTALPDSEDPSLAVLEKAVAGLSAENAALRQDLEELRLRIGND